MYLEGKDLKQPEQLDEKPTKEHADNMAQDDDIPSASAQDYKNLNKGIEDLENKIQEIRDRHSSQQKDTFTKADQLLQNSSSAYQPSKVFHFSSLIKTHTQDAIKEIEEYKEEQNPTYSLSVEGSQKERKREFDDSPQIWKAKGQELQATFQNLKDDIAKLKNNTKYQGILNTGYIN